MKDLYTFDESTSKALQTYETVRNAYSAFFDEFKIPYLTAEAASGDMGGELSHEYHFPTTKGEDNLIQCTSCSYITNEELAGTERKFGPREKISPKSSTEGSVTERSQLDKSMSNYSNLASSYNFWFGITKDRHKIVKAIFPKNVEVKSVHDTLFRETRINPHILKEIAPGVDFSVENPVKAFKSYIEQYGLELSQNSNTSIKTPLLIPIFDYRIPKSDVTTYMEDMENNKDSEFGPTVHFQHTSEAKDEKNAPNLIRIDAGDPCPKCNTGTLKTQTAIELGHTFHLGTRYSKPLQATIATDPNQTPDLRDPSSPATATDPSKPPQQQRKTAYLQMGCHGIGVSRLIGAIANSLADDKGLNWPRVIAPFETIIIPTKGLESAATEIYDLLSNISPSPPSPSSTLTPPNTTTNDNTPTIDTILDDRAKDFGWKLKDADLIGYPVIVVVGRAWRQLGKVEVQCRRLGVRVEVHGEELRGTVLGVLGRLWGGVGGMEGRGIFFFRRGLDDRFIFSLKEKRFVFEFRLTSISYNGN